MGIMERSCGKKMEEDIRDNGEKSINLKNKNKNEKLGGGTI